MKACRPRTVRTAANEDAITEAVEGELGLSQPTVLQVFAERAFASRQWSSKDAILRMAITSAYWG
jgi:hypothetical protein